MKNLKLASAAIILGFCVATSGAGAQSVTSIVTNPDSPSTCYSSKEAAELLMFDRAMDSAKAMCTGYGKYLDFNSLKPASFKTEECQGAPDRVWVNIVWKFDCEGKITE